MPWSLRLSSDIDYIIALRRRARIIGHDTKHREQNPCRLSSDFYDYSRTSYVAADRRTIFNLRVSLDTPSSGAAVCGVAARLLYRSYPEALSTLNALPAMAKEILREGSDR